MRKLHMVLSTALFLSLNACSTTKTTVLNNTDGTTSIEASDRTEADALDGGIYKFQEMMRTFVLNLSQTCSEEGFTFGRRFSVEISCFKFSTLLSALAAPPLIGLIVESGAGPLRFVTNLPFIAYVSGCVAITVHR